MNYTLISAGSDAKIYKCDFIGKEAIKKVIYRKYYRHKKIDSKIRKLRISNEIKFTKKLASLNIDVPYLYFVDTKEKSLYFEYVNGCTINNILKSITQYQPNIPKFIGITLAKIHNGNVIHGDFTTSNLILRYSYINENEIFNNLNNAPYELNDITEIKLCVIDFGLSFLSASVEDKAVDLFVLLKAIKSFHSEFPKLEEDILLGYETQSNNFDLISKKLETVKQRGRKRPMVG
ncbi:EKC/KEOPS complex subunit BUD32, putative [Plasmodium yoelii]|uniref:non-specific serine/threonine protein kinase n=1 Tax=Plasmodium yoelii TaxID=5861 RepID=A0A077Y2Y7_PLAYE|nr:EKC/KEOPS complex subunit BUD32, putative [Plasmodium yoelii]CDU17447.1 O-sialoglycoprotein endopeptidase, putative [Plasmodium yoelii]VTZ77170.1 EKC/KEOPS complex subunit BUD32, putative [Plasmodium yoelii]|eukprot:XP_022811908.1 EKC/KEOPS complex subunit BUD32, putative [Plasmodium yoelii]